MSYSSSSYHYYYSLLLQHVVARRHHGPLFGWDLYCFRLSNKLFKLTSYLRHTYGCIRSTSLLRKQATSEVGTLILGAWTSLLLAAYTVIRLSLHLYGGREITIFVLVFIFCVAAASRIGIVFGIFSLI